MPTRESLPTLVLKKCHSQYSYDFHVPLEECWRRLFLSGHSKHGLIIFNTLKKSLRFNKLVFLYSEKKKTQKQSESKIGQSMFLTLKQHTKTTDLEHFCIIWCSYGGLERSNIIEYLGSFQEQEGELLWDILHF